MQQYTIYCTPEQTKKALELGASIKTEINYTRTGTKFEGIYNDGKTFYYLPTAEQMAGWLEEQGIYIVILPLIKDFNKENFSKADAFEYRIVIDGSEPYSGEYYTRKEATISAIDAALEYLATNKFLK